MQEFQDTYGGMVAFRVVYHPTKFEKNSLKIKEIIAKSLTCVRVLVHCLYSISIVDEVQNMYYKKTALMDALARIVIRTLHNISSN